MVEVEEVDSYYDPVEEREVAGLGTSGPIQISSLSCLQPDPASVLNIQFGENICLQLARPNLDKVRG